MVRVHPREQRSSATTSDSDPGGLVVAIVGSGNAGRAQPPAAGPDQAESVETTALAADVPLPIFEAQPGGARSRVCGEHSRAVNAGVLSVASQRKDGLDLLKVVGTGADRAGVFAVLGDSCWSPGEDEFGSQQTVFGTRRIREFNQGQWDLRRIRLNQLAAVPV